MRSPKPKRKTPRRPKKIKRALKRLRRALAAKEPMFRLAPLTVHEAKYVAAIFAAGTSAFLNDLTKALNAAGVAKQLDEGVGESATQKMRPILDFIRGIP